MSKTSAEQVSVCVCVSAWEREREEWASERSKEEPNAWIYNILYIRIYDPEVLANYRPISNLHFLSKIQDIKTWMTRNFLLLNWDKTEVLILGPKHLRDTLSNDIAALDDIALASNETVRNLGVIFDPDLSFNSHLKQISRTAFFLLRNI